MTSPSSSYSVRIEERYYGLVDGLLHDTDTHLIFGPDEVLHPLCITQASDEAIETLKKSGFILYDLRDDIDGLDHTERENLYVRMKGG